MLEIPYSLSKIIKKKQLPKNIFFNYQSTNVIIITKKKNKKLHYFIKNVKKYLIPLYFNKLQHCQKNYPR